MPADVTPRSILFVCTGNTCRSPLAAALCRRLLAERLGCDVSELPARGFTVESAGLAAVPGVPATPEAVAVAAELGADLAGHLSRPLYPEALAAASDVLAMTHGHAMALAFRYPGLGPPARLLGESDLDDPIGGDLTLYRACAAAIHAQLRRHLAEWLPS